MTLAPIVLFVYNRPWHTRQTIEALQKNELAKESELFVYSDAAKNEQAEIVVAEVREYIQSIDGFKNITIIEREKNWGLADSIIDGVTTVVNQYGNVIVLEDDLVTSPYFLRFMNDGLKRYADDDRIISVHGYVYPVAQSLPEAFFLQGADCWGWATWRRGWRLFNADGQYLLNELERQNLLNSFDFNGNYLFSEMLANQIAGKNDSWAIRWYASAFLAEKLTLYPGRSLINNIGNDNTGTHCGANISHDVNLSDSPIDLSTVSVTVSELGRDAFELFFRKSNLSITKKIWYVIKKYCSTFYE